MVDFDHLTWLWRHHKNFSNFWFLPLGGPKSNFSQRKWFFRNIQLKRFRMMCHMTTLNDFGAKWSFWPLRAKSDRNFDLDLRISIWLMFLSSTDHKLSFDIWQAIQPFKIQNSNFKAYRKIFPDSIFWSCDSKTKKRKKYAHA